MSKHLPMKRTRAEQINIRVEPDLKDSFRKLAYMGVDVQELVRRSVRETLDTAIKSLEPKGSAST